MGSGGSLEKKKNKVGKFFRDKSFQQKREFFFLNDLESPLIFVLFLKGKQNKKENSKCDSLFGKDGL